RLPCVRGVDAHADETMPKGDKTMRNVDTMTERLNEMAEARKCNAVSDDEARKALAALRRDYWNDVLAVVVDAINAIRSGEVSDEDALSDWLWSCLDNH